jgi:Protein of unknown function (DUF4232)
MKFRHTAAVATGLAAAGLAVVGCSPASSTAASSPAATSAASSAAATGSAGAAGSATRAAQSASPASSQQAQASGGTCQAAQLSYTLGALTGTSQRTQVVDLTNNGSSACTLQGFPGVDLHGAANGQQNYTWSLVRQSVSYAAVTLQPGQTGHFSLIYLPGTSASGDMSVTKLIITPPNDYTQAEVTWNESVVLQDGATHPGTYISPVVAGS